MIIRFSNDIRLNSSDSIWLNLIRLYLLLVVVLGHLAAIGLPPMASLVIDWQHHYPEIGYRLLTRYGPQAAYMFVFLSGYFVGGPLLKAILVHETPAGVSFFTARLKRLFPVAAMSLVLTLALDLIGIKVFHAEYVYRHALTYDISKALNFKDFVGNLLFLQPTFVDAFGSNGPLWTLGYIVQYYVVGYALARLYARAPRLTAAAGLTIMAVMFAFKPEWSILFGVWIMGNVMRNLNINFQGTVPIFLAIFAFIASNLANPLLSAALSGLCGVLLIQGVRGLNLTLPKKTAALLSYLSKTSYTLYAVHMPVLIFAFAALFSGHINGFGACFIFSIASIVLMIAAAWLIEAISNYLSFTFGIFPHAKIHPDGETDR